jgi:hypothetical protein
VGDSARTGSRRAALAFDVAGLLLVDLVALDLELRHGRRREADAGRSQRRVKDQQSVAVFLLSVASRAVEVFAIL